jgi:hypothetical protein
VGDVDSKLALSLDIHQAAEMVLQARRLMGWQTLKGLL